MKFLFFGALFLSVNVYAATDYSHCEKQFNTIKYSNKMGNESYEVNRLNGSYYPFELTSEGKIKPHPAVNYKKQSGKEILTYKNDLGDQEVVITRNDSGELASVTSKYVTIQSFTLPGGGYGYPNQQAKLKKNKFPEKTETNYKIEIKNGKCVSTRTDVVKSIGDESRQDVTLDLKLCRDVAQFFKKNPAAASCFDQKLMAQAEDIFDNYYKNNQDIYGAVEDSKDSKDPIYPYKPQPKALKTKLKSDDTNHYPGMGIGYSQALTTEQRLQPFMNTVDTILNKPKYTMMGQQHSSVVSAYEILSLCAGGGYGPNPNEAIINDDALWEENQKKQQAPSAKKHSKNL